MSTTGMLTGNALTVKLWAAKGFVDMYKKTAFGRMNRMGTIMQADELIGAKRGDQVTFDFTGILTGIGTGEGGTLVGNEEALNLNSYAMVVNVFRHAVNNPNDDSIEQQRTNVPFEERIRELLPEFLGSRLDASAFNQLAGINTTTITTDGTVYSGTNRTFVQGLNSTTAPTSSRIVRQGGYANDESITSADTMTLDIIDDAMVLAQTTYPTIKPLDGDKFDLWIAPQQYRDLKRDTTGKIQWYQTYLSALTGGQPLGDSPITGINPLTMVPVGEYMGVRIIIANRVSTGQNSSTSAAISTVRRAVLVGKNALSYACPYGRLKDNVVPLKFFTQLQDYEYYKGIAAQLIYGLKKIVFQSQDFGVIVISTYAA